MKVFISHSENDEALASILKKILEADEKIDEAFIFEEKKMPGIQIYDKIINELGDSDCMVPIITENSKKSPSVHQEIGYAQAKDMEKIPLVKKGADKGFILYGTENYEFTDENFESKCMEVRKYISETTGRTKFSKEEERFVQNSAHFRYELKYYLDDILDSLLVRLNIVDEKYRDLIMTNDLKKREEVFTEFLKFANKNTNEVVDFLKEHPLDLFGRFSHEYDIAVDGINETKRLPHGDLFPDELDGFEKLKEYFSNTEKNFFDLGNKIKDFLPPDTIRIPYSEYSKIIEDFPKDRTPIMNYLRTMSRRIPSLIKAIINIEKALDDTYKKFGSISQKNLSID